MTKDVIKGRTRYREIDIEKGKEMVLGMLSQGISTKVAMEQVGRNESTYRQWTFKDEDFKVKAAAAKAAAKEAKEESGDVSNISFEQFSSEYLDSKLWPHHLNWIDMLEGREPRWLHPAMTYEQGKAKRLLINVPPHHAKSTVITANYVTYRIVTNPNTRVVIVSKTQGMARKFLRQIKDRLTHPNFSKMQVAFGPQGGYKADATKWSADDIYLGTGRDSGQKDPTVQALGIGSQIYGTRADLIILDDVVMDTNAHEWQKQIEWLQEMVITRLGRHGTLLIVGTRVAPLDLYKALRDPKHWTGGKSPFTYMAMPAVLDFAEKPEEWVTLWPETDIPESDEDEMKPNGFYPQWDGRALFDRRSEVSPNAWAMVYQQEDVSEDAIFSPLCVQGSVQGARKTGKLNPHAPQHPKDISSLYTIISMDPAMTGASGFVAQAYNRTDGKIYVLDCIKMTGTTPQKIRTLIEEWVEKYKPQEFRVEINAHQKAYALDTELIQWLAVRGCQLKPHFTGKQKWDVSIGVASMATLFGTAIDGRFQDNNTIELPSNEGSEGIKALVQELITWKPETKNPTDCVMALWFGIIRIREMMMEQGYGNQHSKNRWSTKAQRSTRLTVNLDEVEAERWNQTYGL